MLYKITAVLAASVFSVTAFAQYHEVPHQQISGNEIPVTGPGSYDKPGITYRLMNDISSDRTAIFLGRDVTLDLNGYTVRYADGNYGHIPNGGFEEGTKDWDLSKAPGADVENTAEVHVFVGKKLMRLKAGDEIVSQYVNLPVANRSYFAMCGVTGWDYHAELKEDMKNQMQISIYVEDEQGKEVKCETQYGDGTVQSCPVIKKSPRLGGGVVYAHLNHLPAGKYRVRIKAETNCLVDEIDIRPAMDVGIGIVDRTYPMGNYDHLYNGIFAAFFDYTQDVPKGLPLPFIPRVEGKGTVCIRNGSIENGTVGIASWGIQSTADNSKIILENVKIKTSGINCIAVDVPQATVSNCYFDVENPFIINRHFSNFYAVDIRGNAPSEVSNSEFHGGQGCLVFKGKRSSIHHNYFVNRQMVTNHYSIMAMGDSSYVFNNRIEPETGSGIEIYINKHIEIFNNTIKIKTSPPTCEYGHEEYSTNAIRLADYDAKPGAANGAYGNKIYNNKIEITAVAYPGTVKTYIPMSYGIYYSASGGDNDVFGNDITVNKVDLNSNVITAGLYICGGTGGFGGNFYNNRITTNVPAAWVASMYGGTANTKIYDNTIIKSPSAGSDFKPFRVGWAGGADCIAKNVEFRSNTIVGAPFALDVTNQAHSYSVYWTLNMKLTDKKGNAVPDAEWKILDKDNQPVLSGKSDEKGSFHTELLEYAVSDGQKTFHAPYTVLAGKNKMLLPMNNNSRLTMTLK